MIKIKNTQVWGFEGAIRGMRMPFESFDKSDSHKCRELICRCCIWDNDCSVEDSYDGYSIGEADMALAKKLIKGGSEHRKFLRMIHVQAEIRAPRYWWAEMDTYKHVTKNSSSTMHLITKRELTQDDFSMNMKTYEKMGSLNECLNDLIKEYQETKDEEVFMAIKQMLPESYNQLRTIDTNYECLLNIYRQRKAHRLTEWHEFCEWVESLLYMKEFLNA